MSNGWRLSLFGPVGLHSGEGSYTDFETRRAAKILVLLSFSRSGRMRREALADLLWPEDFIDSTRLRLRQELSRLRRGIGDAGELIQASSDEVSIDKSLIQNDLERLAHPEELSAEEVIDLLSESFLAGWDDAWVTQKRREADQTRINAAISMATKLLSERHPDKALEISQAAMKLSQENEAIVQLAMKAYAEMGSLAEAVAEFRRHKRSQGDPEGKLEKLMMEAFEEAPVPANLKLPPLPRPIDKFYGRVDQLAALSESSERLITLVGPGGIGKSRLAIEAFSHSGRNIGFVSFVECAVNQSPEHFLLLSVLDTKEIEEPLETLRRTLVDQQVTLILDNLEHLADPSGFVRSLLETIPDLRIVVTSRRPMKIAGERTILLGPLEVEGEAIEMFKDLVSNQKAQPSDLDHYREIVSLCGAFPLALRLAASRLRILEPSELIHDIIESRSALKANLPDLADRHRNFDEVVQMSIQSLNDQDTKALTKISVFPGGVTRAIAKSLIGDDVDEVLERLLDASVIWLDDSGSPLRFKILEPIRQFIAKTVGSAEMESANRAFIDTMREFAMQFTMGWNLPPASNKGLYKREAANLHAALSLSIEFDPDSAHRIFERLWDSDQGALYKPEFVDFSNRLAMLPSTNSFQMGQILLCQSWFEASQGRYAEGAALAAKAKERFDEAGAAPESCYAETLQFENTRNQLDWETVQTRYAELIELADRVAPTYAVTIRTYRGMVLAYRDQWDLAYEDLSSSFELTKKAGNLAMQCMAGTALLGVDYGMKNMDRYQARLAELGPMHEDLNDPYFDIIYYRTAALVALAQGHFEEAERAARQGKANFSLSKNAMHEVEIRVALTRALVAQQRLEEAEVVYAEIGPNISECWRRVKLTALSCLAELRWAQGDTAKAKSLMSAAKAFYEEHKLRLFAPEEEHYRTCLDQIGGESVAVPTDTEIEAIIREKK